MRKNVYIKIFMLSYASLAMIGSFQNCAQSKVGKGNELVPGTITPVENLDSGESKNPKLNSVDLKNASSLDLQVNSLFSKNNRNEKPRLLINLSNGEMRQVNLEGQVVSQIRLCLLQEELSELSAIIDTAEICTTDSKVSSDAVCTLEYIYPYAKVQLSSNEIINLGEKTGGCGNVLDLCEEHKKALNGFISYLSSNLDNRKCL
ncbi:MAG: hypothetical protein J0M15_04140 [Deltaproteobacteria bacterium]|nr:hypothetical protein [Deltaproteobacteria bacterium]